MDPNVCLANCLELAEQELAIDEGSSLAKKFMMANANKSIDSDLLNQAKNEIEDSSLAELIMDLHEWIRKGGFLPTLWVK